MPFDSTKEARSTYFCPVCLKIAMVVQDGLKSVILPHFSRENGVLTGCDGNGREIDDSKG